MWINKKLTIEDKILILLMVLGMAGLALVKSGMEEEQPKYDLPPEDRRPYVKSMDYNKTKNGVVEYNYYSDEEIREMRNQNPNFIIKVPGRRIISREAQFEEDLEEYIEENPDLLENY